jgi:hypothetical protein
VTPNAFIDMGTSLDRVDFNDALMFLQELLGARVRLEHNHFASFFGLSLEARLDRIETLPPDNKAIRVVLDNCVEFFLDPDNVNVSMASDLGQCRVWVEFQFIAGQILLIERAVEAGRGPSTQGT